MSITSRDARRLALLIRGGRLEHRGSAWMLVKGRHCRGIHEAAALLLLVVVLAADA